MNRTPGIIVLLVLFLAVGAMADPLTVTCPDTKTIRCNQLEDMDVAGRAVAAGGCGAPALVFRDSTLAVDSLVIRIWTAADTCGAVEVCFQPLVLTPAVPRIAILPMENLSTGEEGARVLQRLLEEAMGESSTFVLISPAKVDEAIMRGRVRQPILMDDEQRRRLSQSIDATYFVVGSLLNYEVYQDQYSGPIPMISCALQLQRAHDGKAIWSESLHAVGNDGEWLFALGVEHDITRLGRNLAREAALHVSQNLLEQPCISNR